MNNITLTKEQQQAINLVMKWFKSKNKIRFVLGGIGGSGKSTIIPYIIDALGLDEHEVYFCSYTGKAAYNMMQKGVGTATTIHRLIYQVYEDSKGNIRFKKVTSLSPDLKLIVCDESSFIDNKIQYDLEAYGVPILYSGDYAQLQPIGNQVTYLMLNCDFKLTQIHRVAWGNPIIQIADKARKNEEIPYGNYGGKVLKIVKNKVTNDMLLKADQILCAKNYTRHTLNDKIRKLKGFTKPYPEIGDKLICIKNCYETGLVNGMLGKCINFDHVHNILDFQNDDGDIFTGLEIDREIFDERKAGKYQKGIQQFDFGYTITIFKFQGSEANKVLLYEEFMPDWETNHARLLYTGISRAKEKLIIVS